MKYIYLLSGVLSFFSLMGIPHSASTQVLHTVSLPTMCMSRLWAEDFSNLTMDEMNSQPQPVFSFSPHRYIPDTLMTACNIPGFGTPVLWQIWTQTSGEDLDGDGKLDWNADMVVVLPIEIIFLEHSSCCCQPATSLTNTIKGIIQTAPDGEGVELVNVSFLQEGASHPTFITNPDGRYSYGPTVVTADSSLIISPDRNDNHKLGVTTIDLVKLQKHLLGIQHLKSPYQWIAADANNSNSLSAIDFVEIRKIILGFNSEFSHSRSWRFIRSDVELSDSMFIWPGGPIGSMEDLDEYILIQIDSSLSYDFIGVKTGDITGAYDPNFTSPIESRSTPAQIHLQVEPQLLSKGQIIEVPVYIQETAHATGFQFTLNHSDLELAGIQPGQISMDDEHFAIFENHTTFSWFDIETVAIEPYEPLFTLSFVSKSSDDLDQHLQLTSDITDAEWYSADEQILIPDLVFRVEESNLPAMSVNISPNPWIDEARIKIMLSGPGETRLTVTDAIGRIVYHCTEIAKDIRHEFKITEEDLPMSGYYFYTVTSSHHQVSGKMIRIDP